MMTDVQPTNNPVPSDHPADARDNFKRIDEVVNLQAPQTNPTRTGKILNTLFGIESKYIASPINGGVWASGVEFTAYNQYMAYNGVTYKPSFSTQLPYTTQSSDPTSTPDSNFVQPFSEINSSNIADFSPISYTSSGSSSAVDQMVSGSPVGISIGQKCNTGGTTWIRTSSNGDVFDFKPLNGLFLDDWIADSDADDTIGWSDANDYLNVNPNTLNLPPRTVLVSMAQSSHPNACVLIPAKTKLLGAGKDVTVITRPSSERGVNGVLIVNRDYDTNGGYGAAGGITIDSFTITDGTATPNRTLGDLIGIGHCDGFTARNIKGGNHDQHLFDICASRNVTIEESCEGENLVNDISSSTVQIDGASSLGIWGLFQDNTNTTNINVRGKYRNTGALRTIDLFHADDIDYENIDVNCEVDGAYVNNGQCIGIDDSKTNINVTNLDIRGIYKTNNSNSTAVRLLLNPESGKKIDQVDVDVDVSGNGRGGVLIGVGTTGVSGRWGTVRSKVKARIITDYTGASTEIYGAQYNGIDNLFMSPEDDISVVKSSTTGVAVMAAALIQDCKGDSDGGRYQVNLTDGGSNKYVSPVIARHFFSVIRDFDFRMSKPILEAGSGVGHHFLGDDNATWGLNNSDNFLLTKAKFINQAQISNILEPIKLSDGTNGYRQVQLDGSTDGEFSISSGQFYSGRNMGMKKTGAAAELVNIDLIYAPNSGTLDTDAEEINFAYVSATSCAGTQIVDINPTIGTFSIVTGDAGVSAVINNSTFQPFLRPSGVIKVWVGI